MEAYLPTTLKDFFREMIRAKICYEMPSSECEGGKVREVLKGSLEWIEETGFPHLETKEEANGLLESKTDPELKELFAGHPTRFSLNLSLFH